MKKILTILLLSLFAYGAYAAEAAPVGAPCNQQCPYQGCTGPNGCPYGNAGCNMHCDDSGKCYDCQGNIIEPQNVGCGYYGAQGQYMGRRGENAGYYAGHGCRHGRMFR